MRALPPSHPPIFSAGLVLVIQQLLDESPPAFADRREDFSKPAVLVGALEEELEVRVQRIALLVLEGAKGGVRPTEDPAFGDRVDPGGVLQGWACLRRAVLAHPGQKGHTRRPKRRRRVRRQSTRNPFAQASGSRARRCRRSS